MYGKKCCLFSVRKGIGSFIKYLAFVYLSDYDKLFNSVNLYFYFKLSSHYSVLILKFLVTFSHFLILLKFFGSK